MNSASTLGHPVLPFFVPSLSRALPSFTMARSGSLAHYPNDEFPLFSFRFLFPRLGSFTTISTTAICRFLSMDWIDLRISSCRFLLTTDYHEKTFVDVDDRVIP